MIVLFFILYYPMRLILSFLPWIPIPTFGNFLKYPEIIEKWAKWATWCTTWIMMNFILALFTEWYLVITISAFFLIVAINLIVMYFSVKKFKKNGKRTE